MVVDLRWYDYVREAQGVCVPSHKLRKSYLAMLVLLRATGRREMLVVYTPDGRLVHQELLASDRGDQITLCRDGDRSTILLEGPTPVRYAVQ